MEGLTTWPRVSHYAYDARIRGVPVNPTEDRIVVDRAAVLDLIRKAGENIPEQNIPVHPSYLDLLMKSKDEY